MAFSCSERVLFLSVMNHTSCLRKLQIKMCRNNSVMSWLSVIGPELLSAKLSFLFVSDKSRECHTIESKRNVKHTTREPVPLILLLPRRLRVHRTARGRTRLCHCYLTRSLSFTSRWVHCSITKMENNRNLVKCHLRDALCI